MPGAPQPDSREQASLLRWLNTFLRGLHLAAVIVLGASLLGAPVSAMPGVQVLALTGATMLLLDIAKKPAHLREAAGLSVLLKLALVAWMVADAAARPVLYWLIVLWSVIFAHAPARFRHAILIGQPSHSESP